jgi:DNA-binding transcriptional ArsR family regulator
MGALDDIDQIMAAAGALAAGTRMEILCLLAEQDELLRLAALPFARAVRPGGAGFPVDTAAVAAHFDVLSRSIERSLGLFGQRLDVPWQFLRGTGDTLALLEERVREGDILIVSREELHKDAHRFVTQVAGLLQKAEALVVPAKRRRRGPVLAVTPAVGGDRVVGIAQIIARGSGRALQIVDPGKFSGIGEEAATVVESFDWALSLGTQLLVRQLRQAELTTVLVGDAANRSG